MAPLLAANRQAAADGLRADLDSIFAGRMSALVAYGPGLDAGRSPRARPLNTLALVDRVSATDLSACAAHAARWRKLGLAMPLLLSRDEFVRSLDVFPFEYGDILARHTTIAGDDPFEGVTVRDDDLRRACEAQAKSHLIHLRGGFLETGNIAAGVAALVQASASPLETLLRHVARLRGRPSASVLDLVSAVADVEGISATAIRSVLDLVADPAVGNDEAMRLYPDYLVSVERLVAYLDAWRS
jgi:hypothetical protein